MKQFLTSRIILFVLLSALALGTWKAYVQQVEEVAPEPAGDTYITDSIIVTSPQPGDVLSPSSVQITGEAAGWYFEGTFFVELRNASDEVIAETYAVAQDDWMTAEFVPFISALSFPPEPKGTDGVLILRNHNPSGLVEHEESISIPVKF